MRLYSLIFYAHTCVHTSIQTYCSNIIGCICMHTYNLCTYRHYRLSSIVWRCVLGIAPAYLLDLFILPSPALVDNLSALLPEVILWCLMLARPLNSIWPSRLWVTLLGTVSQLNIALFHGICPARFTSSLKLLFSPSPGLGAPLSSYLEVALYKFHR